MNWIPVAGWYDDYPISKLMFHASYMEVTHHFLLCVDWTHRRRTRTSSTSHTPTPPHCIFSWRFLLLCLHHAQNSTCMDYPGQWESCMFDHNMNTQFITKLVCELAWGMLVVCRNDFSQARRVRMSAQKGVSRLSLDCPGRYLECSICCFLATFTMIYSFFKNGCQSIGYSKPSL